MVVWALSDACALTSVGVGASVGIDGELLLSEGVEDGREVDGAESEGLDGLEFEFEFELDAELDEGVEEGDVGGCEEGGGVTGCEGPADLIKYFRIVKQHDQQSHSRAICRRRALAARWGTPISCIRRRLAPVSCS